MDVVTTSLEALLQRAINSQNQQLDAAATEAFCVMVTKKVEGVQIASRLLASSIQSTIEWQALQALTLLDICMKRCGPLFNSEIGKFRFLNEMIKLVSPKYHGNITPTSIREKILNMFKAWTINYPHEVKIKEAYEMLKKQGVIKDSQSLDNNSLDNTSYPNKVKNPIFDDEEKSKLLQKLIQSKKPEDLQAANRLIKTMVKEDEKRTQEDSRRLMELESIHSNITLLSEMLDSYTPVESNKEDIDLMKDLYHVCECLQPTIARLAQETQDNEDILVRVIQANDDLEKVSTKYARLLLLKSPTISPINDGSTRQMLLDLNSPDAPTSAVNPSNIEKDINLMSNSQSNMELLGDIFGPSSYSIDESVNSSRELSVTSNSLTSNIQPINIAVDDHKEKDNNGKAFDDLNEFEEQFLRKSLSDSFHKGLFDRKNDLIKQSEIQTFINRNCSSNYIFEIKQASTNSYKEDTNDDDALININVCVTNKETDLNVIKINGTHDKNIVKKDDQLLTIHNEFVVKPLADIDINLETITPGTISPITVLDEKNGITVVLHFAKDSPRPDVSVIVVTTTNKNCKPLTDYLFQAVVPKKCKCRLYFPSGTDLPAHNPFLPPSAITQIMLISNPYKEVISLKFMMSYTINGETVTEMGEIDELPIK